MNVKHWKNNINNNKCWREMKKFNQKEGILITKKEEKEINTAEGKIKLIPAWKFALLEKI